MRFSGKTAVVTGGSRGIGRAICLALAQEGADIVLCYTGNEAAAQETVSLCRQTGGEALAIQCDVSDAQQVDRLMKSAVARTTSTGY